MGHGVNTCMLPNTTTKQTTNIGHWDFPHVFHADDWFGFIYRIIEKDTRREYIGKKQLHTYTRKAVKGRKNKKRIVKESKWRTYTSSSTHLNAAIATKGMDNYIFRIESLHSTKGSLAYAEVRMQIIEDVLRSRLDCGIIPKYFNRQVGSVRYIPPVETPEESLMKRHG